jgi:hypothetical protein
MLGLGIKGGVWIGFCGVLMGMGLGGKAYRPLEILLLFVALMGLHLVGIYLLNEPFDPAARQLPRVYFSGDWRFFPDKADLAPRRECWGGYLASLGGLWCYAALVKRDVVARNLGLAAMAAGAVGFPLGQTLQAYHAWNAADFREGWLGTIEPYMNWWNAMETIFGMTAGAGIGLGAWLNRTRIGPAEEHGAMILPTAEGALIALHVVAITAWNFVSFGALDQLADQSLAMGLLPLALVFGGRYAPYFISLPIVALPICGKTLRELAYYHADVARGAGWLVYVILPLATLTFAAVAFARLGERGASGRSFARWSLLLTSWLYFWLNYGFFRFPWPWSPPTARTPSAIVFSACLAALTAACLWRGAGDQGQQRRVRAGAATTGG